MYLILYLKRSFCRRFKKHLHLYLVLTCALLLPLLVSFYRDSQDYGWMLQGLSYTKGQSFKISNVIGADCQYFQEIDGLSSPFFEDGAIYLKILDDNEWKNLPTMGLYSQKIQQRIDGMEHGNAFVVGYEYGFAHGEHDDIYEQERQQRMKQMYQFSELLTLFMVLIVYSAYKSHLRFFSVEMATLSSFGASRRQIARIFLVEFGAIFVLSAASAVLISAGTIKALFDAIQKGRNETTLTWLVFRADTRNTAILILIYFLALAVSLVSLLIKYPSRFTARASAVSKKYRRKRLTAFRSPACVLAKLWRQRTNRVFLGCLCISVPLAAVFLCVFQFLTLSLDTISTPVDYEIHVSTAFGNITDEMLNDIEALDNVAYVIAEKTQPVGEFYIDDKKSSQVSVRIHGISDLSEISGTFEKYDAVVSVDSTRMALKPGDKIDLVRYQGRTADKLFGLTARQVLTRKEGDSACDVYIDDVLLAMITSQFPCTELDIKLQDADRHAAVVEALSAYFQDANYRITNLQAPISYAQKTTRIYYVVDAYIFAILFSLVFLILYTKLCDYIRNQFYNIRIIYNIGASRRTISISFLRQAAVPALIAALTPIFISISAVSLMGERILWNGTALTVYLGTALLMVCVYLCPIQITLNKYLKHIQLGRLP